MSHIIKKISTTTNYGHFKKLVDEPTRVMYVGVKMKKKKKVNKT